MKTNHTHISDIQTVFDLIKAIDASGHINIEIPYAQRMLDLPKGSVKNTKKLRMSIGELLETNPFSPSEAFLIKNDMIDVTTIEGDTVFFKLNAANFLGLPGKDLDNELSELKGLIEVFKEALTKSKLSCTHIRIYRKLGLAKAEIGFPGDFEDKDEILDRANDMISKSEVLSYWLNRRAQELKSTGPFSWRNLSYQHILGGDEIEYAFERRKSVAFKP